MTRRRRTARALGVAAVLTFGVGPARPPEVWAGPPPADSAAAQRAFDEALGAWDPERAAEALGSIPAGPGRALAAASLEHFRAEYRAAADRLGTLLERPDEELGLALAQRAAELLSLARAGVELFAERPTHRSAGGRFELAFVDAKDELLKPYLGDALERSYDQLALALGVAPPTPVRIEVLGDPADLARLTTLSLDAVYTTGTIGICKFGRVMLVSPRALLFGYGWLDAASHEYVHLLVTLKSRNRAPVWLQEGLAKLYETRWRASTPELPEPEALAILVRAIERDELVTFEQMHPSFALLPSQELAAQAYAQVHTMLMMVHERGSDAALQRLLDEVAEGADPRAALAAAWGGSFDDFDAAWKRWVVARAPKPTQDRFTGLRFASGDDADDPSLAGETFAQLGAGQARQHARLGALLTMRGHPRAAAVEYRKARRVDARAARDPGLARRLGELLLALGEPGEARPLLELAVGDGTDDPNLWAAVGRARRLAGDLAGARQALDRAIAKNPFIPGIHCDLAELTDDPERAAHERAACRDP